MKATYRILCLLVLIVFGSSIVLAAPLAPLESGSFAPAMDTYTDRADNTNPHDDAGLVLQTSLPAPASGLATTVVFLKFDLRPTGSSSLYGATGSLSPTLGSITQARLNLAVPASCGFPAPNVAVSVFPVADANDTWLESTLIWGASLDSPTHPPRDTTTPVGASALATLDEGTVGAPGIYYHWSDTNTGTYGLAEWLQAQRTTGDGFATLRLEIVTSELSNFAFEDREETAVNVYSCIDPTPGEPTLQVADASGPLAVTLSTFHAADPAPNWPLVAAAVGLLGIGLGAVIVMLRRRAAARA